MDNGFYYNNHIIIGNRTVKCKNSAIIELKKKKKF